jgi:hypothetical protein
MFTTEATYASEGIATVSTPERPKTRRQRLADRRAKERAEYERRKLAEECTRCGVSVVGRGDQLCAECREYANSKTAASSKRLAADRRRKKQCARCGRPSPDRYECIPCLASRGKAPLRTHNQTLNQGAPISHGAIHASARTEVAWTVEGDGRRRRRGRGRGVRGHPSRADTDAFDMRIMRTELERAEVALVAYHQDENQDRPRIQKEGPLREVLGHLGLLRRQLDEFEERVTKRLR